jgi:glycosyltransferase involved in cell wall biosynthesis
MKVLLMLCGTAPSKPSEQERQLAAMGEALRASLITETLDATIINYSSFTSLTGLWARLYRCLPYGPLWIAVEGFRRRREADVLVTWSDMAAVSLTFIQWLRRDATPHVAMLAWVSKPHIKWPLKLFGQRCLSRLVMWTTVQARYATEHLGFPAARVSYIPHFVDEMFWRPQPEVAVVPDLICAAGNEMRDYPTLLEAVTGLNVRCHIATDRVKLKAGQKSKAYSLETLANQLPANVTLGKLALHDLRRLYAQSALVIVPIQPSNSDNGVTVILEAMAMAKTVICSRTEGQVDVIEDGVTGFYVNPQDPLALRAIISRLLAEPDTRQRVGAQAQAYATSYHRLDQFADGVKQAVAQAYRDHAKAP